MKSLQKIYLGVFVILVMICSYGIFIYTRPLAPAATQCLFKTSIGIACPACGGSHAIQRFFDGHWYSSVQYNGLVFFIILLTFLAAGLGLIDLLFKRAYLIHVSVWLGNKLKSKPTSIALAMMLIGFWIYHIIKYS